VHERLIEMSVGETVRIGRYWVTLLDVDGDQLCLQVEPDGDEDTNIEFDGEVCSLMHA
jgi:hypothetical protein